MHHFLIPKSRDLISHNPGISGLKNGPGSRDPGIRDPGIAIPSATVYYDNFWHTYTSISFLWSVYSTFFILSETENFIKCLTVYITMAASGCHFEHLQYLCSPLSLHFHLITNKSALFRATNRLPVNSVRENVCNDTKQRKKSVFLI